MGLRKKAGEITLLSMLRRHSEPQRTIAYEEIKRIGLLMPLRENDDIQWVDDVLNQLSKDGKECVVLGLLESPIEIPTNPNIIILEPEALAWNLIPKEHAIKSFISINFDLLLNLCTDGNHLALDYVAIKTPATFRIGRYEPRLNKAYGLMVKGEFVDSRELLKAIKHYLVKIH